MRRGRMMMPPGGLPRTGSLNEGLQQILNRLSHLAGGRRRRQKRIRRKSLTAGMIARELEELLNSVNGRCFDIGIITRTALDRYRAGGDARSSGERSEHSSGNGSIMRLATVPIRCAHLYSANLDELSRLAAESSLPTHASDQCVSACRYLALVLAALIQGEERDDVLSPDWGPLQQMIAIEPLHPLIQEVAAGSFRDRQPPAIKGSGWVVQSLEASLWVFHDADSFEEAVLRAVNLGDDADTTGAVCGQLAGAYWGESGIPDSLRSALARKEMLENALAGILGNGRT